MYENKQYKQRIHSKLKLFHIDNIKEESSLPADWHMYVVDIGMVGSC